MSILPHFPLELGCEDYSFLDQAVEDFEHVLGSFFTDFVDRLELDVSLDEADAVSLFSSGFLHSVLFLMFLDDS